MFRVSISFQEAIRKHYLMNRRWFIVFDHFRMTSSSKRRSYHKKQEGNMKTLKVIFFIIGILLLIAGVIGGFYVGFWVMLVGGIVDIVDAFKAPITIASMVGFGILKIFFSGVVGALTFMFCWIFGAGFIYCAIK